MVTWWSDAGGIQALSARPTGFLQYFDTVGLVTWPAKIVPDMTYNVFDGTLNLAQSINTRFNSYRVTACIRALNKNDASKLSASVEGRQIERMGR